MSHSQPIRLLLLDDHTLFRESLRRLLEDDPAFDLVGAFASIHTAVAALSATPADVVLLDFDLGTEDGFGFLEAARLLGFEGRILIVTGGISPNDARRALQLGVSGIFLKLGAPDDLIRAIHQVVAGEVWLDPQLSHAAIPPEPHDPPSPIALTERERLVLRGVFEGLSNKEIGARHDFSEAYVKAIMQQLFGKTGVRNRSQLVRVALERPALYNIDP